MAVKAYLLIETSVGKTREVSTALTTTSGVSKVDVLVDVVTGPYDIIAVLNADDMSDIGNMVTEHVHTVDGVVRTVTCVAVGG